MQRIKDPWQDQVLRFIAFFLTAIWVVVGFIPAFWMLSSAFKNLVDAERIPPVWIPRVPQRIEVAIDFTKALAGKEKREQERLVHREAQVVEWFIFDKLRAQRLGEVVVRGYNHNQPFYGSRLTAADFNSWRYKIWATTYLDRQQILRQLAEADRLVKNKESFAWAAPAQKANVKGVKGGKLAQRAALVLQTIPVAGEVIGFQQSNAWGRFFDNFVIAWRTSKTAENTWGWGRYISNSAIITLAAVLLQWFVGAGAAYALSWLLNAKWSRFVTMFFLATLMIPPTVTLIPLYTMVQNWGLINNLLAVILPSIPNAFAIYMFKGFFDGLPKELFEAARMDGATDWQIYRTLVMPLSKPVFMAIGVMVFLTYWNGGNLLYTFLVLKDISSWTFPLALYNSVGAGAQNMSLTMAMTIITSIPTLIIFMFFKNSIKEGMLLGAIKM